MLSAAHHNQDQVKDIKGIVQQKKGKICHHLTLFPPVFFFKLSVAPAFLFSCCLMLDDHVM